MGWLEWFKNFWTYSKSERKGILFLIGLIVVVYSLPYILNYIEEEKNLKNRAFQEEITSFQEAVKEKRKTSTENDKSNERVLNPFPFNPNQLTRQEAKELGLRNYVIDNILKYRQEGGRFDQPQDFAELYGLADSTFQKLKPYIRLPDQQNNANKPKKWQSDKFQPDTLFSFNPNQLSIEKWRQLGLPAHVILNIKSYQEQGGYFAQKQDLDSIYGMKNEIYATLAPYIKLKQRKDNEKKGHSPTHQQKSQVAKKEKKVEVNSADSLELINVKGIGPFYAKMILKERRKLGGFVYKEQLKDIYGMQKKYGDDSLTVYQSIKERLTVTASSTKKIDINSATVDRLADHPYIDYNLAENIVNYRKQHGTYDSLKDVHQLYLVNEDLSRKLAPYLQLP